jgi:hypothetical protein
MQFLTREVRKRRLGNAMWGTTGEPRPSAIGLLLRGVPDLFKHNQQADKIVISRRWR